MICDVTVDRRCKDTLALPPLSSSYLHVNEFFRNIVRNETGQRTSIKVILDVPAGPPPSPLALKKLVTGLQLASIAELIHHGAGALKHPGNLLSIQYFFARVHREGILHPL